MSGGIMAAALDYHEPDIVYILVLSSFLLALNVGNYAVDTLLSCGLIAQLLIGIAWGTPGAKLLDESAEALVTSLGYLGLILLVFEGGLSTNVQALRRNLLLSTGVAFIGITVPIALSFILIRLADATPLQSFASGAALCSTSLGTIFTVLKASGLVQTRLGSILTSAAMLDDVVGLIMVQVISNLNGTFEPASVIRPVGVSVAFAMFTLSFCFCMRSCANGINKIQVFQKILYYRHSAFIAQTLFLLGMVTAASYAGTSNLFAAYLTGVSVSWWYTNNTFQNPARNSEANHTGDTISASVEPSSRPVMDNTQPEINSQQEELNQTNGALIMFEAYYMQIVQRFLKPFFFASIGFAIPITQMFNGPIVWRGLIYSLLMMIAKMFTGLWLVRLDLGIVSRLRYFVGCIRKVAKRFTSTKSPRSMPGTELSCAPMSNAQTKDNHATQAAAQDTPEPISTHNEPQKKLHRSTNNKTETNKLSQSISLYPASILGTAMVARGEIGFLIAATARSSGIFNQNNSQVLYLTVIWAVVLCTIVGPVSTGLLVKRVKRLQKRERTATAAERSDPLGQWGLL